MNEKHGLSQYRLNYAKDWAKGIVETITKVEMMWQLSEQGKVDEEVAENFISKSVGGLEEDWKYLKSYIEQREDKQ